MSKSESESASTTQLSLESLQTESTDDESEEVTIEHVEAAADAARAQLPPEVREEIPPEIPAERIGPGEPGSGVTPGTFRDGVASAELREEHEAAAAFALSEPETVTTGVEMVCSELDAIDHERRQTEALDLARGDAEIVTPEFSGVLSREWLDIFRRHAKKLEGREPVIIVTPYCWFVYGMDSSNVAYHELYIPREAWEEYNCSQTGVTAFDWDSFTRMITSVQGEDLAVEVTPSANGTLRGAANLTGEIRFSEMTAPAAASIGALEPTRQRVPDFGENLPGETELVAESGKNVLETLENASDACDILTLYPTAAGIVTTKDSAADGYHDVMTVDSPRIDYTTDLDGTAASEGVHFSGVHLKDCLSKLLKAQRQTPITVRLEDDKPLELKFRFDDGAHLRFMLAPRYLD